jgi:formyltetrahydrofolate hydrolase
MLNNSAILLLSTPIPYAHKGAGAAVTPVSGRAQWQDTARRRSHRQWSWHVPFGAEWDLKAFDIRTSHFAEHFNFLAEQYKIKYHRAPTDYRPKVVILASGYDHCLADLLYRQNTGELDCEVAIIISQPHQGQASG